MQLEEQGPPLLFAVPEANALEWSEDLLEARTLRLELSCIGDATICA
uniref:Uncharacterized protein n=1 Tax=Arundo donax TaxID=35708 RepID=A0A0A9CI51_ARUDO